MSTATAPYDAVDQWISPNGEELYLYARNTGELYERRQAIERLVYRDVENTGQPSPNRHRQFVAWLELAGHRYAREFPDSPYPLFTDADRSEAATQFVQDAADEYRVTHPDHEPYAWSYVPPQYEGYDDIIHDGSLLGDVYVFLSAEDRWSTPRPGNEDWTYTIRLHAFRFMVNGKPYARSQHVWSLDRHGTNWQYEHASSFRDDDMAPTKKAESTIYDAMARVRDVFCTDLPTRLKKARNDKRREMIDHYRAEASRYLRYADEYESSVEP
jgi:hypothetical protein